MGDIAEIQITPETPGRPTILNPFESPNDYHRLHEPLVPSPSVFRSSKASSATPAKFKWSIDEMASLLPVHIDPEDIHRQSLYLSQTRIDTDIEEKRQNAIEQFFTKGAIVPSPWGALTTKQSLQMHLEKTSSSPLTSEAPQSSRKTNATCQTILSLPVDFDLEKILGNHYKMEEDLEQVQESLSSSSLRRKLFLDGNGSGSGSSSESSSPPSPERDPPGGCPAPEDMMSSVMVSPLQRAMALTPSSGQFSSSPIQGRGRAYSLGSVTSPMFPEKSSPVFKSPTLSPILLQRSVTPLTGERKRLTFLTPESVAEVAVETAGTGRCGESPYVEGCSPIRSCSPLSPRHRARVWASPPHISPILHPDLQEKEDLHSGKAHLPPMDLDSSLPCSPLARCEGVRPRESSAEQMEQGEAEGEELVIGEERKTEEEEDEDVVEEGGGGGSRKDFCPWAPEEEATSLGQRADRGTGSVPNAESTHMFVSLLAEGSSIPYDVSMQVDSGYNTCSVGITSLMDAVSSDSQGKELWDTHIPDEGFSHSKHTKQKLTLQPH